jgi:hypothetical protein
MSMLQFKAEFVVESCEQSLQYWDDFTKRYIEKQAKEFLEEWNKKNRRGIIMRFLLGPKGEMKFSDNESLVGFYILYGGATAETVIQVSENYCMRQKRPILNLLDMAKLALQKETDVVFVSWDDYCRITIGQNLKDTNANV